VIVVGHTGCGGAIASYAQPPPSESDSTPPDSHLMQFLDPLIRFRHTLPEGSDVNDLIRENIKDGVGNLVVSPVCLLSFLLIFLNFSSSLVDISSSSIRDGEVKGEAE
jgi:carbonic anhydrase